MNMAARATGFLLVLIAGMVPLQILASGVVEEEFNSALRDRPSLMHGEALFDDTCVACHGPDGGGQPNGSVPAIAAQPSTSSSGSWSIFDTADVRTCGWSILQASTDWWMRRILPTWPPT